VLLLKRISYVKNGRITDLRAVENETSILDFLPNPGALEMTTNAIRELLGRLYHWARG